MPAFYLGRPGAGVYDDSGMSRPSSFQRLALWTTAVTYLLILVGGLVRASGAGLGCPDWPRCFGSWIPPASAAELPPGFAPSQFNPTLMWTEYLNRLLGVSVGLFILAATVSAWRHHRHEPKVLWPTVAALLLTGFEGWLGGRVVAADLAPWIVTAHLIVALVIVSLLLYATFYAFVGSAPVAVSPARRTLGLATYAAIALMLVQVGVGTFVRGRVDEWLERVPRVEALAGVGAVDVAHRNGAVLMLGVIVLLWFRTWLAHRHEPALMRAAHAVLGLTVAQIAVGLVMVYAGLPQAAQVAHLTLASLLLGAMTVLALLAHRWPERSVD
jgi:cytochrome c oxidase assembly protein subunit 15